jgi:hypothetical protein
MAANAAATDRLVMVVLRSPCGFSRRPEVYHAAVDPHPPPPSHDGVDIAATNRAAGRRACERRTCSRPSSGLALITLGVPRAPDQTREAPIVTPSASSDDG